MPDTLNKQTLINLLIDSPLREPIKINLIDIVNNTSDPDLPKIFPTITKELEIFQKATERRMKLADETIAKLGGTSPTVAPAPETPASAPTSVTPNPLPPLDLPPLPASPTGGPTPPTPPSPAPVEPPTPPVTPPPLSVPPLDLPPLPASPAGEPTTPTAPTPEPVAESLQPLGGAPTNSTGSDEAALAEIQKELDSLKSSATTDATPAPSPTPAA